MTVNGASSSNLSSLYNSTNIISGLASGLDTEGMIESLVQSYSQKITSIQQQVTKTEWQQESYRSIISKLADFTNKYASYTSSSNLLSSAFFTNATKVTPQGEYANCVTASGKSSSEIILNSVSQLASSARWSTSGIFGAQTSSVTASSVLDFSNTPENGGGVPFGTLDGTLSLTFGDQTINLSFDDVKDSELDSRADLVTAIQDKLKEQTLTVSKEEYKASEVIQVELNETTGEISLKVDEDKFSGNLYIAGASGTLQKELGLPETLNKDAAVTSFTSPNSDFTAPKSVVEYISGASMTINLNGTSRTFNLPEVEDLGNGSFSVNGGAATADIYTAYANALNESFNEEFGDGKLTASFDGGKLSITGTSSTDQISIQSSVNDVLGFQKSTTSYVDVNKTLEQLDISLDKLAGTSHDKGDGKYAFTINGKEIGTYTKDTKLSTILNDINNSDAGLNVSYSKLTNNFVFTSKETGADQQIKIQEGEFSDLIFGHTIDKNGNWAVNEESVTGKDAKFNVTVNGSSTPLELTRSSNTVDLDGLTLNLKKTFTPASADDAVTFDVSTNADPIVDAIKNMVNDYNTIMAEVKKAYATMPLKKTDGTRYEPLTESDSQDMSESAIERYEEKAKTGLLFADSTLTALHEDLESIFSLGGEDGKLLEKMGITVSYSASDNSSALTLDETKLREMLNSDPEAVANVFTRTASSGSSGIMQNLKSKIDVYARTTGAVKGLLVQKAGSPLSPLSMLNNSLQTKIDDYNTQIEKWQTKLSSKIDYYTKQFTRLETLISQMNSQSSALSGLMGGY